MPASHEDKDKEKKKDKRGVTMSAHPASARVMFVVGSPPGPRQQATLDNEARQHRDLLQHSFLDSYQNLTYKSLALLTWATRRCPHTPFLAKVDDDTLVNPWHLSDFFRQQQQRPSQPEAAMLGGLQGAQPHTHPATTLIYGRYDKTPTPIRNDTKYERYIVSKEEYPEQVFPPFVHGPAYVLGREAAREILRYAPHVPLFKLEDVYITGLVARAAGLRHVQVYHVLNTLRPDPGMYGAGTLAFMEQSPHTQLEMDAMWHLILRHLPPGAS